MSNLTSQDKCSYLANVMAVARSDGIISVEEHRAFQDIAMRIRASPGDMAEARKSVEDGPFRFAQLGDPVDRLANFEDMLMMGLADGRLHKSESALLEELAVAMQFTQTDVNLAMRRAKDRLARLMAPQPPPIPMPATEPVSRRRPERRTESGSGLIRPTGKKASTTLRWDEPTRRRLRPTDVPAPMIVPPWQTEPAAAVPQPPPPPPEANEPTTAPIEAPAAVAPAPPAPAATPVPQTPAPEPAPAVEPGVSMLDLCIQARAASMDPEAYCLGQHAGDPNVWGCRLAEMPMTAGADWLTCGDFRDDRTFVFDLPEISRLLEERLEMADGCPHLRRAHIKRALAAFPKMAVVGPNWTYRLATEPDTGREVTLREYIHGCPMTRRLWALCLDPVGDGAARLILRDAKKADPA